ncbi:uncharacterized protein Z519_12414 [Cladophialophora bantiana CBS 173.52]|uniref:Phosphatidylethanolamine-binding protein n=1 Tax=Cladophialophora bantiana (strain ATCC 10958 / CBS 173.52 / CDC B-1940 / NIH 8579) TaxID=1442370 RepID=A0A0D2HRC1_CLAB1|nr:uncharacterized protein Z519_12414 [Cladophialophora bantiana CBS 173.52]KIW86949.1 hypothetical protein Z519_12414 [Cladophialophora bantiana CBS 173.52]
MRLAPSFALAITGLLLATQGSSHPVDNTMRISFTNGQLQKPFPDAPYAFSTIRDVLLDHSIIGDVLDDFEPSYYLDITYPKSHETVLLGDDIPVESVSKRPIFTFHSINSLVGTEDAKKSTFTLVLTDPDAKSRNNPKWSEMCHWILTNLTTPIPEPSSILHLVKAKPGELEEYLPPAPPPKTGAHRYVFVLLEGTASNLEPPADRKHWGYGKPRHGVRDWAQDNHLTVVGANFFYAQNEKQ